MPQSRELYYDMKKDSVTVGMLRGRVSHEMAHPANQASVATVHVVPMPILLASFFTNATILQLLVCTLCKEPPASSVEWRFDGNGCSGFI